MYNTYFEYIPYFLIAFFSTLLLTPWIGKIGWNLNILALPPSMRKESHDKNRHLEKPPVPSIGGIAVIIPFVLLTILSGIKLDVAIWLIVSVLILHIGGVIDTVKNVTYKVQLLFHFTAILIFILSPITVNVINIPGLNHVISLNQHQIAFSFLSIPMTINLWSDIFLAIWIFIVINAYKLNGGTCALIEGNAAIASIIILLVSVRFQSNITAVMGAIFAGNLIAFGIFNFHPWKIYGGSSAKTVYGFIIATLAVVSGAKLAITFMVAALPIVDMVFVVLQRIIEKKTISPKAIMLTGDTRHLHHKLLQLGFTEPQVALFEYTITLIIGLVGAYISGLGKLVFLLLLPILLFSLILYITVKVNKTFKSRNTEEDSPEKKYTY